MSQLFQQDCRFVGRFRAFRACPQPLLIDGAHSPGHPRPLQPNPVMISKITPVLIVNEVEPCAQFWQKLGFERVAEVPHEGALGFVILVGFGIELMYQSVDSVKADHADGKPIVSAGTSLFVEVDDLDKTVAAVAGAKVLVPERTTFYGMREVGVADPGGNLVLFAQKTGE